MTWKRCPKDSKNTYIQPQGNASLALHTKDMDVGQLKHLFCPDKISFQVTFFRDLNLDMDMPAGK